MRPELKEYNFDWMLWSLTTIASNSMNGTQKEISQMLPLAPYFRGILEVFVSQGKAGSSLLDIMKKYMENIVTAHDRGKKIAISTFCFSPAIFYAMDVVPITLELLTVMATTMFKRGTSDYLDYCCEVGFTETSCSSQRGSLGAYLAGLGEEIDFVVCDSAGVCDTNANAYAFTSAYLNKPMFQLNYPPTLVDERARTYHLNDYKA
jgi:benzoyl-CoA reductase/2-hydroxyglutaryl-CoA dehydratase subunit BcrC/BadD/HgdB